MNVYDLKMRCSYISSSTPCPNRRACSVDDAGCGLGRMLAQGEEAEGDGILVGAVVRSHDLGILAGTVGHDQHCLDAPEAERRQVARGELEIGLLDVQPTFVGRIA